MEEWNCKLVLVGNSRSGKTSLVQRFIQDQFLELYTPTGFEKYAVTYEMAEIRIHFHLWDTSGAQAYDTVRPLAYQDSKVFLLCFQIGDPNSLDDTLNKWHPEIRQQCTNVPIILCGCQSDLRSDTDTICDLAKFKKSPVTSEQALAISRRIGALTYVETSAKIGARTVRDAFEVAALAAFGKLNKNHVMPSMQRHRSFLKLRCRSKMDLKDPKTRNCAIM